MVSKEVLKKRYIICPFLFFDSYIIVPLLPSSAMFTHHSTSASLEMRTIFPQRIARISPERIRSPTVLLFMCIITVTSAMVKANWSFHLEAFRNFSISSFASRI